MNRRKFLNISAVTAGAMIIGGGTFYTMVKDSDPLSPFFEATQKVFTARFGDDLAATLEMETKQAYEALGPEIPYIGGKGNMFTEWLNYSAYYLAMYQALSARGHKVDDVGKLIFETYEVMADYPKWFLRIVGRFRYGEKYKEKLRSAAAASQKRKYSGDFVSSFIEGDGENFDYGLDITECGICKLYSSQGAEKLARYMCLSDYVVSKAFNRGLVRYKTIAEGAEKCDFRYKKEKETFVYPLREGWPLKFLDDDTQLSQLKR
jgi:hypothetical protein